MLLIKILHLMATCVANSGKVSWKNNHVDFIMSQKTSYQPFVYLQKDMVK